MKSSSLLFHGETAWHKLEKIPSFPVLFDVVQLFQSFPFSVCFCLCVIWSVKCQYYFILLFNKTFSFLHFSPCAFLISTIFPLHLQNAVKERWLCVVQVWRPFGAPPWNGTFSWLLHAVPAEAPELPGPSKQKHSDTQHPDVSQQWTHTHRESLWSEECSLGNHKTERWEGNIISLI